jgi:Domain of unknown function (DUF5655)
MPHALQRSRVGTLQHDRSVILLRSGPTERTVDVPRVWPEVRRAEHVARLRGLFGREVLEGKAERARELFDRLEGLIAACGQYEVAPAKTRVAFMARVRFAGLNAISDRGMTIAFALPRPLRHRRIRKVENIAPGWYGHWMKITSPDELDDELLGWLRESYHQMGLQERLAR